MPVIIDGTNGISGVDGSASTPAVQGTDTNTGMFFPAADTIAFAEGGTEVMRIDSSGNVRVGSSSTALNSINSTNTFGFKNRIINGAMMIDQRNAGASVSGTGTFPVDRFSLSSGGVGVYSGQRSTTAPANFLNSIILTVTTPDSSVTGTDNYTILQRIEGFNFADMAWGTANASTITISFWVRSSITGTYFVRLANNNYDRSYCASYTISAANTWEYKTITIAGDTTGTWATNNSSGVAVEFVLGNGTTYQTSSANTWIAGNYLSTSSQTNWISTNGATFYITGVQLEKGSTATSFDYRPYGTELMLCQRYWTALGMANTTNTFPSVSGTICNYAVAPQNGIVLIGTMYPVQMRTAPTVTFANVNGTLGLVRNAATGATYSVTGYETNSIQLALINATGVTAGMYIHNQFSASAEL